MKSIKANLIKLIEINPNKGSYILLAEAVKNKNFSRKAILKAFSEYVSKSEYSIEDKKKLIHNLYNLSNPSV